MREWIELEPARASVAVLYQEIMKRSPHIGEEHESLIKA